MKRILPFLVLWACGGADDTQQTGDASPADASDVAADASLPDASAPDAASSVPACAWQGAITLGSGIGDHTNAQIAFDPSGNAIAVWQGTSLDEFNVLARRYDAASGAWESAQTLGSGIGDHSNAQIAFDSSGNAMTVWQGTSLDEFNVLVRRFDAVSETWESAETLGSGIGDHVNPQIAFDSIGNAVVVWQGTSLDEFDVLARRYDLASGTWASTETLGSGFGDHSNPQIAFDLSGNALAVWQGTSLDEFDVLARRYDALSETWATAETLGSGFGDHINPQIAFDASGNAIAIWQGTSLDEFDVLARRFDAASGTWASAETLGSGFGDHINPQIALASSGDAIAIWQGTSLGEFDVLARRYDAASETWQSEVTLGSGIGDHVAPGIAFHASDEAVMVWAESDTRIKATRFDGLVFGDAETIASADGPDNRPQLALDSAGNVTAVWQSQSLGEYEVLASRCAVPPN